MDISKLPNPYDYRNPVREAALFAGRHSELGRIDYELGQARADGPSIYIAVHGQRASGKTSLLNQTEGLAEKRGLLPVRVELVPGQATPAAFFRKVYEELVEAAAAEGPLGDPALVTPAKIRRVFAGAEPEDGFPLEFPEAMALAGADGRLSEAPLRHDLAYFVKAVGRPVALLVDEAQLMAGHEETLSVLRALGHRLNGWVFVLAGTSGLLDRISTVFSPLLRQFTELRVERFTERDDIEACVQRPLQQLGLDFHSFERHGQTLSQLFQLTDGNPYEIQLYCHEMFARWQRGTASGMALTAEMLEAVRSRMESGRDVLDRELVRTVRGMNPRRLRAFNVLCSALDDATVDDVWFAYRMVEAPHIRREELDACRAELVEAGLLQDTEVVRLAEETELFDDIYIRLWTMAKLGSGEHAMLMGRRSLCHLLTQRLDRLLGFFLDEAVRPLPTCCPLMPVEQVEETLTALESSAKRGTESIPSSVEYVHKAILNAGVPQALDVTTVTCVYGETRAMRWLCSPDTVDARIVSAPGFREAGRLVSELGGELSVDRVRLPLGDWSEIKNWLRLATGEQRCRLATNYFRSAFDSYGAGDPDSAIAHFSESFTLEPSWGAANGVMYVALAEGDRQTALDWAGKALNEGADAWDTALSSYNAALAHLLYGDEEEASRQLARAGEAVRPLAVQEHVVPYLLVPRRAGNGAFELTEEKDRDLGSAIVHAVQSVGRPAEAVGPAPPGESVPRPETVVTDGVPARTGIAQPPPPVVLVVATEWVSVHGGLSTFNRGLCRALATAGADVYCVVLDASEAETAEARAGGVTLLRAPDVTGGTEAVRLTCKPGLPHGLVPDLVIGHGRITGPAARLLVSHFFPEARRLHFVHMAPDEIEWLKPGPDTDKGMRTEQRTEVERQLGAGAHRLVAVGPRLYDRFLSELAGVDGAVGALRIDPGFDSPAGTADSPPRTPPPGKPKKVLLVGRLEDARLKGADLAARACGQVDRWRDEAGRAAMSLLVRGAPEGEAAALRERLLDWADNPKLEVTPRLYSPEEERLTADMMRASVVVMPSRSEGFGLVGAEALTLGVPTLVSEESGLAELLWEVLGGELAAHVVVPMSGEDERDAGTWARAIDKVLSDPDAAFRRATEVRDILRERVTWAAAATRLLAEVPDRPAAGEGAGAGRRSSG